jgi:dTDP-glucose 4,6-dehydratase
LGEVFNIGADCEKDVLEISRLILTSLGAEPELLQFVPDRPGHVRRHAVNSAKIQTELGWQPLVAFEQGIEETVAWYRDNPTWWRAIIAQQAQCLPNYSDVYGFDRWLAD